MCWGGRDDINPRATNESLVELVPASIFHGKHLMDTQAQRQYPVHLPSQNTAILHDLFQFHLAADVLEVHLMSFILKDDTIGFLVLIHLVQASEPTR